ncbi:MAG: Xaa-Pro dipeptidyl-peptidase [Planctomycetota bacterium]
MRHVADSVVPFLSLLPSLLFPTLLLAQQGGAPSSAPPAAPAAKAQHVFEDGQAQPQDVFKKQKEWVQEFLFVEAPFDTDNDGRPDRLHVDVIRPLQTKTEGLKVPVVYETSPYFAGTGPMDLSYYHDVKQELGEKSPPRAQMAAIPWGGEVGMIGDENGRRMNLQAAGRWLQRGFAVVHSCSPGTGWSQGCATVGGTNETLAPKAVIDWLCGRAKGYTSLTGKDEVKAEWCSGKVGMTGTSYNGGLPIAAATTGVEGLAAIIPISPPSSWYRYYRSHGLVRSPGGYLGEDMDVLFDFIASCEPKRRQWCIEKVRDTELAMAIDRVHGDYNDFWHGRDYLAQLDKYTCPTLAAHGLNDWNVMPDHSIELFIALKQKGVPSMLFLHQGGHGGEPPFPLMNRWFTRWLFGVENGVEHEAKAWVVREGERRGSPTQYADYPNPDAAAVVVHPRGDGNKVGELGSEARAGRGKQTLVDDVGKTGAELATAVQSENRLLFATGTFAEPVHLSGRVVLKIRVAADKPACNLSAWLVALPWEDAKRARGRIITRGWADPQNAGSLRESKPLVPGKFVDLQFELQPDDQVIPAGERIALLVFASDSEFTLWPKPGTKLTVDLDGTSLSLPVVGGEAAWAKALAGDGKR